MAKVAIEARDMVITYNKGKSNEFNALNHVSVEIYPREYIILFGPSGCGKSTLLYSMLGGLQPASGQMLVFNEDIYAYTPAQLNKYQQSTIGIVYQQFNLISSISTLDNVALPMIFMGVGKADRNRKGREMLRRFGIPERLEDKLPTMMSGGQQQRIAVSRALVNDPEILLADEPVGNLDSISAEHVMDSFQEINEKDRKTVILVTHDAKYLPYAHRVIYMRDGVVRRIVVNPTKRQVKRVHPGETIVTEIEQLARLYPYAEPMELKVKSVVNFATQKIGFRELERLENATLHVLKGEMDRPMLMDYLMRSVYQDGVGLDHDESEKIVQRIFSIVEYSKDVEKFRTERMNDGMFMHQRKFIDNILDYIASEVGTVMSADVKAGLKTAIAERVGGIIVGDEFAERLVLPLERGGLSFSEADAYKISRHLEKLIAQGGYVIRANELLGAHS
ncbi:MAG: ABC transporter ATP-binding protein [Candidatus Pacebacteria bacterium]|jgi:putative ABC transport system ATP-binding protein|nr:ABC transporter ATP-binding protein [Candidatus Paceibacterota bacterium]